MFCAKVVAEYHPVTTKKGIKTDFFMTTSIYVSTEPSLIRPIPPLLA